MPQSDSEDFESADEGHSNATRKERKKRNSSSNYSDNLDSDFEQRRPQPKESNSTEKVATTDGWDDFDVDESETAKETHLKFGDDKPIMSSSQDTGWNDFGDWGESDTVKSEEIKQNTTLELSNNAQIQNPSVTTKETEKQIKSDGWGWGWGVDSLLSTATAGISTITSQVSQGITTVLETGIGAPNPEELARITKEKAKITENEVSEDKQEMTDSTFQFGSLLSGVTKFVENTGTKVISGGLDTLEVIGKKTMEVLQDGDPGLVKKRAMLGLETEKPILSQILREAKERADEEDKVKEAKREAKEVHYESLFDDFEGLVHLEALEMLSRQVSMRIEERLRSSDPEKRLDIKETLQQVAELCEMPEDDEDDDYEESGDLSKEDVFHEHLQRATRDIGLKLQFQPLIKQYTEILTWLESNDLNEKAIYKRAVSGLAHATALCVELYHKTGEMLLVKPRRSTADEADALTQLTLVLTKHVSELASIFTEELSKKQAEDKDLVNNYITNVFLEAGNSSKYIQNAFQLALPIIQIGAV
ncbi:protein FAM114A2 [Pieris brassicae]|uniref:protein FAM114A2 n=1 Tax=Pieris brassicae TaxID=7116 RepID=UPI001E65F131|nr:protein FAM114A2 [Pieris brassicae]